MPPTPADPVARLYKATRTPQLVHVPPIRYLCLDGQGDPNTTPAYAAAVSALYAMSYAAKFAVRKDVGQDVTVSPLEGLWWSDDLSVFTTGDRSGWRWTMMIRQPDVVALELVDRLKDDVAAKKSLPVARDVRLVELEEGAAAQVLHVGPYAAEGPTIAGLHDFLRGQGFALSGKHHAIYVGDPRRAAPERLRTIIRQPGTTG